MGYRLTNSPYLSLFHNLIGVFRLLYEIAQQITVLRILHHDAEVPRPELILLKEAVIDTNEELAIESF